MGLYTSTVLICSRFGAIYGGGYMRGAVHETLQYCAICAKFITAEPADFEAFCHAWKIYVSIHITNNQKPAFHFRFSNNGTKDQKPARNELWSTLFGILDKWSAGYQEMQVGHRPNCTPAQFKSRKMPEIKKLPPAHPPPPPPQKKT